jgi:hypothetical protein
MLALYAYGGCDVFNGLRELPMTRRNRPTTIADTLKELVDCIVDDDWALMIEPNGERFYYILGANAWSAEIDTKGTWNISLPLPRQTTSVGQHYTRSQIAAAKPASVYIGKALERLHKAGVDIDRVKRFAQDPKAPVDFRLRNPAQVDAFLEFLQALTIQKIEAGELDLNPELRGDIANARQKLYLRELSERYAKVLDRAARLAPLAFADEQLEEASRCYLYGFNRAAIVLSAAALETHLKRAAGLTHFDMYEELVDAAFSRGKLGTDFALRDSAVQLFKVRTMIVHKGLKPQQQDAERFLDGCRGLLETLYEHEGR